MTDNNGKMVDIHYHGLSPGLAKELVESAPCPTLIDIRKNIYRTSMGTEVPLMSEDEQLAEVERSGIHTLAISVRTPAYFKEGELPSTSPDYLTLSRTINDYLASVCQRYPGRFLAFADIPLSLGEAAVEEMRRALNNLGLAGICLYTNYDGKTLDLPEFRPFFEEADRHHALIFMHPNTPFDPKGVFQAYHMYTMLGFSFDTTLTMSRLVYAGILEQFPNITFILCHVGGVIPFLWWRLDRGYRQNWPDCRSHVRYPPTHYLKRCYYGTELSDTESLMLAYKRVGDHLVLGTDNPYHPEIGETLQTIEHMDIPSDAKAKILGGNALALTHRTVS